MVIERQDLGLLRLMKTNESALKLPISYVHHFPGWFRIFNSPLSPYHLTRAILYFKQDSKDFMWLISIEAGHTQRIFLTLREAEFFRDNLIPQGADFSFTSCGSNQLMIEKFNGGYLLQKFQKGFNTWCLCPSVCASHLTLIMRAFFIFINLFQKGFKRDKNDSPEICLEKNLLRECTRRILGYRSLKRGLSKDIGRMNLNRIVHLYDACAQLFHLPFFVSETEYIADSIREAFSYDLNEEQRLLDQEIADVLNILINPYNV